MKRQKVITEIAIVKYPRNDFIFVDFHKELFDMSPYSKAQTIELGKNKRSGAGIDIDFKVSNNIANKIGTISELNVRFLYIGDTEIENITGTKK